MILKTKYFWALLAAEPGIKTKRILNTKKKMLYISDKAHWSSN